MENVQKSISILGCLHFDPTIPVEMLVKKKCAGSKSENIDYSAVYSREVGNT